MGEPVTGTGPVRRRWVIGNWKQNLTRAPAATLARAVRAGLDRRPPPAGLHVGVAPSYLALDTVAAEFGPTPAASATDPGARILLSQDVAAQESGAHTGEVGPAMLAEAGVRWSLVGHSERRALYGDHDALVAAKVRAALDGGLGVVLCAGEALDVRAAGDHESHVISMIYAALAEVTAQEIERVIIAYEPVWAIGTGQSASAEQAAQMHAALREALARRYTSAIAAGSSILYGGSVKPQNAASLLATGEVDGFLVGGAALDPDAFLAIIEAAAKPAPDPRQPPSAP